MSRRGTLESIVLELSAAIGQLKVAVHDLDNFKSFMRDLGWDVEDLPAAFSSLVLSVDELTTTASNLGTNPSVQDVLEVLDKVSALYNGIKNFNDSPTGAPPSEFLPEFPLRLFQYLLLNHLNDKYPQIYTVLDLLGAIKYTQFDATATRPSYSIYEIDLNRIPELIKNPAEFLNKYFNWGSSNFDYKKLIEFLFEVFASFGFNPILSAYDSNVPISYGIEFPQTLSGIATLNVPFFTFNLDTVGYDMGIAIAYFEGDETLQSSGLILQLYIPDQLTSQIDLGEKWKLNLLASSSLFNLFGIIITPGQIEARFPFQSATQLPDFGFGTTLTYISDSPFIVLGRPDASLVAFNSSKLSFNLSYYDLNTLELAAEIDFKGFQIVLKGGEGDGFLSKVLGDTDKAIESELGVSWSNITGFNFKGGGLGLDVNLNQHIQLGPILINELAIGLKSLSGTTGGFEARTTANLLLSLGPFTAIVEMLGVSLKAKFEEGNAGPFDINVGFKPPNGLGLFLETDAVKGGGYLLFDHDNQKYAGVAELTIKDTISVKAIGLISTKMPDGSKGFSMLLIISAEFTPINIGFGFTLNGVGGLIGVNRTMKLDVLRSGVKTGAIANILFPVDPVQNAPTLISEIGAVFPVAEGRYAFGLMGKFGWGTPTLITVDLGLIIEVPKPIRLAILGVVKLVLPDEDQKTIRVNVNFLGTIDFEKKQIAFDASIYDSQLKGVTLSGDMALRISGGNNKNFLLSIGGFHPNYQPPPSLLYLSRITVNLLSKKKLSLVLTTYLAVTSNTVQFGAKVALNGEVTSKLSFKGHVSLDVLFQFSPFYMDVLFSAYLALLWKGKEKMSISVQASLQGPSGWVMNGSAEVKILLIKFKVKVAAEWGKKEVDTLPGVELEPILRAALDDIRNWEAELGPSQKQYVKLRKYESTTPVVQPLGTIRISQKQVPLNIQVHKYGNQPANDAGIFTISDVEISSNGITSPSSSPVFVKEDFAPAQYRELSDTAKLSSPSFERYDSGIKVSNSDLQGTHAVTREIKYEVAILGREEPTVLRDERKLVLEAATRKSASNRTPLASTRVKRSALAPSEMTLNEESFGVVNSEDLTLLDPSALYPSMAEALDRYAEEVITDPLMKDELMVIREFEIAP